jgi:hypothetical protein
MRVSKRPVRIEIQKMFVLCGVVCGCCGIAGREVTYRYFKPCEVSHGISFLSVTPSFESAHCAGCHKKCQQKLNYTASSTWTMNHRHYGPTPKV